MEDIARIGFKADTTALVDAKKKLEDLPPATKKAETGVDLLAKKMNWAKDATGKWRDEFGRFVPQTKLAEAGIAGTTQRVSIFGSTIGRVTGLLGSFGGGMVAAMGIGAATFGISAMVSTLTEFEYQMSAVAAVSGATGKTLEALRDTAKDMGATTEFSATQAATGLKLLIQSGKTAEQAITTLPAVLNLATTEAMDLGTATEYVNSIMAGFGLGVQDAARVTDVLVYASNAASTGVGELGEGMKYVAPIAAALGISIEDTAAAMGVLSDAGLKGSQAGTSLRGSIAALANPSSTAADELKRLGVTLSDINPQTNSIIELVDTLADAGLDAAGAFKIFGTEAAPAFLALIANKDKLKSLTGEMGNVAGEAQRIADYMRDNLMGSFQNLSSAVEGLIIALGDAGLIAILRFVFDTVTLVIGGFISLVDILGTVAATATAPMFEFLSENLNLVKGAVIGVGVAIATYYTPMILAAIGQATVWTAVLGVGLVNALRAVVAGLLTVRGALLATGFGAIVVLVGLAVKALLDLSDKVGGVGNAFSILGQLAGEVWRGISESAKAIPPALNGVWAMVKGGFSRFVSDMIGIWARFLTVFKQGIEAIGMTDVSDMIATGPLQSAITAETDAYVASTEAAAEANKKFAEAGALVKDAFGPMRDKLAELTASVASVSGASSDAVPPVIDLGGGITDLGDAAGGGGGGAAGKVEELKTALELLGEEFQKLTEPFDQAKSAFDALDKAKELGIISNDAFVASLGRIESAFMASGGSAEQWAQIIGDGTDTVAEKLDELGKKNLTELGGEFANLAVDGSASFGDLAKSIIKDLLAIAWQAMVVKPLLAMMGITPAAQGAVVDQGGMKPFAKGGAFTNSVVNSPTPFKFAQGGGFGLGVMGEAGAEAVMPLTRGPDGSLGVQMYGQAASVAGGASQAVQRIELHVTAEEGEMFRPTIRAEAEGIAIEVSGQAVNQINEQLPGRVNEILDDPRVR